MIRSTDIEDTYKGGEFLRQWSVADSGQCVCAVDAHATDGTDEATLDAQVASNAKIRVALAAVDGLESAKRVAEPEGDIPKTVTETDIDGNEVERPYKPWAEYDVAQATIAAASDATNQFALVRSMGVQSETLPKTVTTTEPILDEDGNDSGETREVITVVKGETIDNPDYDTWVGAWDAVDSALN